MGIDSIQAKVDVATQKAQQSAPPPPPPAPAPAPAPAAEPVVAKDEFIQPKKPSSAKVVLDPLPYQGLAEPKNTASQTVTASQLLRSQAAWAKTQASTAASTSSFTTTEAVKATTATASSDPAESAKRAEADYNSARFTAQLINPNAHQANLVNNVKDPAYQRRYIELLNQNGELSAEADKAFRPTPTVSVTTLPGSSSTGVSNSTAFTSALQAARGQTISDEEIRTLAQKSDGMYYAAKKLSPPIDPSCEVPSVMKSKELDKTTADYKNARAKVEELNKQLAEELAAVGPALSDQQRADYTRRFKEKYSAEYKAETVSVNDLAKALESVDPSDTRFAQKLYAGYQELAQGPLADRAAGWVDRLEGDPALRGKYAQALNLTPARFDEKFHKDIRDEAVATMMTNALAQNSDPEEAQTEFFENLGNFKNLKEQLGGDIDVIKKSFAALIEYKRVSDFQPIANLAKDAAGLGHLGSAVTGVMALAGLGIAYDKGTGQQTDYLGAIKESLSSSETATEMFAGATKRFANLPKVAKAGEFVAKATPWLGLAANTASYLSHVKGAAEGSTGLAIACVGDVLAVTGSALNITVGGAVLGEPLVALGTLISTGGELWDSFEKSQQAKNEQKELLGAMGIQRPEVLADNRENIERLKSTGLSAEQIQTIANRFPEALIGSYNPSLVKVINAYNLAGESVVTFLDKLNTEARARGENLGVAMQNLPSPDMDLSFEEWRVSLERLNPRTGAWARGLDLYGGQTAPQPVVTPGGPY